MHTALLRSTLVAAIVLAAGVASPASAQTTSADQDLKARCAQLTSFYDRYGASRGENSDGARNLARIGAGIDCGEGNYEKGIAAMEALLKQKQFDVPPPTGLAQQPVPAPRPQGEQRRNPASQ